MTNELRTKDDFEAMVQSVVFDFTDGNDGDEHGKGACDVGDIDYWWYFHHFGPCQTAALMAAAVAKLMEIGGTLEARNFADRLEEIAMGYFKKQED